MSGQGTSAPRPSVTTHGRRVPGTGSVRFTASGKWEANAPQRHGRKTARLGMFESRREAEAALAAHLSESGATS